jgi:diguanylate cyclase
MRGTYSHWLVALLIVVAVMACALNLAVRLARADHFVSRPWLSRGPIPLGVGIWSMRFIGILTLSLPIPLGHDSVTTLETLAIAIVTLGLASKIASGPYMSVRPLGLRGLVMGAGIFAEDGGVYRSNDTGNRLILIKSCNDDVVRMFAKLALLQPKNRL